MPIRKQIIPFILLFIFGAPLGASPWSSSASIEYSQEFFFTSMKSSRVENQYSLLELKPTLEKTMGSRNKLLLEAYFYHKFEGISEREKNFFDLPQGYVETRRGSWRLRLGQQTISWGVMDIYSPGDVINSTTLFDPLNSEKLGAMAVDLTWSTFGKKIQWLYLPRRRGAVFPEEDSRWLPRNIITDSLGLSTDIYLPEVINYNYEKSIELPRALNDNYGLRLSFTFGEVDWHLFYFQGLSARPQIQVEATVTADVIDSQTSQLLGVSVEPDIQLRPIYFAQRTVGNSLVWAPEWGIVRWETTFTKDIHNDPRIDENILQNALGVEKPLHIGTKSLVAQIQYYLSEQQSEFNNLSGTQFQIFNNSLLLNGMLNVNDSTTLYLSQMYNFDDSSLLGVLGSQYKWSDNVRIEGRALWLNGSPQSLIGSFKNNDSIQFKFTFLY